MVNGLSSILGAAVLGGAVIFVGHTMTKDKAGDEGPKSKTFYDQVLQDAKTEAPADIIEADAITADAITDGVQVAAAATQEAIPTDEEVVDPLSTPENTQADWWEEQQGSAAETQAAPESNSSDAAMSAADTAMQQVTEIQTEDGVDEAQTATDPLAGPLVGMAQPAANDAAKTPTVGKAVFRNASLVSKPDSNKYFTQNKRLIDKPDNGDYFTENKRFVSNDPPEQFKSPCQHSDGTPYTGPGTVDNPFAPENPCLTPTIYAAAVPDSPSLPAAPVRSFPAPEPEELEPYVDRAMSPYRGYNLIPVGAPGPMPTLDSNGGSSYRVQRVG